MRALKTMAVVAAGGLALTLSLKKGKVAPELPPVPPPLPAAVLAKAALLPVQTSKPIVIEWYWTPRTNCAYLVQRSTSLTGWQTVTGYSKAAGTWKSPMTFRFTNSLTAENFRLREIYLGHEDLKKL